MADVNQNKLLLRTLPQCAVQPHHAGLPKIQTAHCAGLRPRARPAAALQTKYSTAPTSHHREIEETDEENYCKLQNRILLYIPQ